MNRYYKLILTLGILSPILLLSSAENEHHSLRLEAYSGPESILLIWDLPEKENIASIQLLRSSDMMSSYEIIDLDDMITDRYLDKHLDRRDLLFYRVVIELNDGSEYSSPLETPALARPLGSGETDRLMESIKDKYPVTISSSNEIVDVHSFNSALIHDYLIKHISIKLESILVLQMFLQMEDVHFSSFINEFNLNDFNKIEFLFNDYYVKEINEYIRDSYETLEPLFRQSVLLSPEEWKIAEEDVLNIVNQKLEDGKQIYKGDQALLESLPGVRMTGMVNDGENIKVDLTPLSNQISIVYLKSDNESIEGILVDSSATVIIPETWNHIELWINDMMVQSIPLLHEIGALTISLDGQCIFQDEVQSTRTMKSIPDYSFELNEIGYNFTDKKFNVEMAGYSDAFTEMGVFFNDSLLFEWNVSPKLNVVYIDSSSILPDNLQFGWLHLCEYVDDQWVIVESCPLDLNQSFHRGKVPDLGTWSEISFRTFGVTNDITQNTESKELIPEIFALYQNYPNPFNSTTKIKFDLLEESVVSLYVSDARGRKLEIFLDDVFLVNGIYSFNWSGEFHSSGVYFITLEAQSGEYLPVVMSRKMIYLK